MDRQFQNFPKVITELTQAFGICWTSGVLWSGSQTLRLLQSSLEPQALPLADLNIQFNFSDMC